MRGPIDTEALGAAAIAVIVALLVALGSGTAAGWGVLVLVVVAAVAAVEAARYRWGGIRMWLATGLFVAAVAAVAGVLSRGVLG